LVDSVSLRDFLLQNAGLLYQRANAIRRIPQDPLYIVSGCIKSDSWAVAAYPDLMDAPDDVLKLSRRVVSDEDAPQASVYDWTDRGTAEARFGSNSGNKTAEYKGKDQCLFLRGFKLAFSQRFYARWSTTEKTKRGDNLGSEGHEPDDGTERPGSTGAGPSASGGSASEGSSTLGDTHGPPANSLETYQFPEISRRVSLFFYTMYDPKVLIL
jgi:hypothetical protein